MHWLVSEVKRQVRLTADEPARFVRLFGELFSEPGRIVRYRSFVGINRRVGERWSEEKSLGTQRRTYDTYADYLEHQASKLQHIDLGDYDVWFRDCLAARLLSMPEVTRGLSVLCLAARIGTEVKAFQDAGCFAVGIDLNPGQNNRYVLQGDFHDIQFPAASIDLVYTNSMDHAFDACKMLSEVGRVLKPGGIFMLEAPYGLIADQDAEQYESFWWKSVDDLERLVVSSGFKTALKRSIDRPFAGVNMIFRTGSQSE